MTALDGAVTPLSARSLVLSLLLGAHPPHMTARDLTTLGEHFGIAGPTMRVALSRMTAAGDLVLADATYTLCSRHLDRQSLTEALISPRLRPYDGMWKMGIVVDRGRTAPQRTALRIHMARTRFAELREGVWMRPDNLAEQSDAQLDEIRTFTSIPADEHSLVRELWDLDGWASHAYSLIEVIRSAADAMTRLATAAAAVRHLCTDPALPAELAPQRWPADELRWTYDDYRAELRETYLANLTSHTISILAEKE